MDRRAIVRSLLDWFAKNARDLPWRRTRDPYAIWISEIMLQQTQVATVIPYWQRWMEELPTILELAQAKPARVHKLWEGLGYYTRARNLHRTAKLIVRNHERRIPQTFDEVLQLPGIGRYTAGAICSIAFNQPCPVLDGNVIRVLSRIFGIEGNPRESQTNQRLWHLAEDLVLTAVEFPTPRAKPQKQQAREKWNGERGGEKQPTTGRFLAADFNQAMMELGALICTARQPRCSVCPCARFCTASIQQRTHELPALNPRPRVTNRRFVAFVLEHRGRFLVRQRPEGVVNAFLWEFPNVEISTKNGNLLSAARKELGGNPVLNSFCSIKHSITRFRITLDVFRVSVQTAKDASWRCGGRWLTCRQLHRLPFTSAHKKILNMLHTSQG
jgi:A/G-specific adenine glycosylase